MRTVGVILIWLGMTGLIVGCNGGKKPPAETGVNLAQENARLKRKITEQDKLILELKQQLARLRGLPAKHLEYLVQVSGIEFGRYTGARDKDNDGFDDGIIVYMVPRDRTGDKIKAAGEVEIELWDLEAAEGERELGRWHFGIEELPKYWLSLTLTNHFKFELDWAPGKAPKHKNLTLKLKYTDVLTGKEFEIQKLITTNPRTDQ